MSLDTFEENLRLAMQNFAGNLLVIVPKDVYHNHEDAKQFTFDLENKVLHYVHKHLILDDKLFFLNPSVAVFNYMRGLDVDGSLNTRGSTNNKDPNNKELPPVQYSQLRFLSEYNGIPHSFELRFFGKFPLIKDGNFTKGKADYWKIDEKRII